MKLENTFMVPVSVEDAWRVLLDVEQIAPCLPGATVEHVDGDEVTGRVKVKLGPIAITYRGMVNFVERDEEAKRAVMVASAKEARGSGTASARISTLLTPVNGHTRVTVGTDLDITGKPAQFGRGVMQDVSGHLVDQFATSLARELENGTLGTGAPEGADFASPRPSADAIDLMDAAGGAVGRRGALVLGGVVVGLILGWLWGRRR
jgi:carbon monoxide dehydrogenase subunit G